MKQSLAFLLLVTLGCAGDSDGETTADGTATDVTATSPTTTSPTTSTTTAGPTTAGPTTAGPTTADTGDTSGMTAESGDTMADSSGTTGAAGPTWNNFAMAFFESYCWECHGAGDPEGRDYSTLPGVLAESAEIRCGTAPIDMPQDNCAGLPPAGQFPIGGNDPSDEDRLTLIEWIDAGAPEG